MKKRVTPSKSTTRRELLFRDRARGLVVTTRYWPWVLSWHESVIGILESPELSAVGLVGAVPSVACSTVWGVPDPVGPWACGVGLGCVVGDVAGVGLV